MSKSKLNIYSFRRKKNLASGSKIETSATFGFTCKAICCSLKFYVYSENEIWIFRKQIVLFEEMVSAKYGEKPGPFPYLEVIPHALETAVNFISYPCIFFLSQIFFDNMSLIKIEIEKLEPSLTVKRNLKWQQREIVGFLLNFTEFCGSFGV